MKSVVEEVSSARNGVLALGTARMRLWVAPALPPGATPPPGALWRGLRAVWRRIAAASLEGQGVIDFTHRRYALNYGSYAVVFEEGQQWGGRAGRARRHAEVLARPIPLWLMDILAGCTTGTSMAGGESGSTRVAVSVDLSLAAQERCSVHVPAAQPASKLHAIVAINHGLISRVELQADSLAQHLELFDHGVALAGFDWAQLPSAEDRYIFPGPLR